MIISVIGQMLPTTPHSCEHTQTYIRETWQIDEQLCVTAYHNSWFWVGKWKKQSVLDSLGSTWRWWTCSGSILFPHQVLNLERVQALEIWLKATNTTLTQVNGQRKYGGPPEGERICSRRFRASDFFAWFNIICSRIFTAVVPTLPVLLSIKKYWVFGFHHCHQVPIMI